MNVAPALTDPAVVEAELRRLGARMDGERELPASVRRDVRELAERIGDARDAELPAGDPSLRVALQQAAFRAYRGAVEDDPAAARREVRIAVEQLRQVFRDLAELRPIDEDVPSKQVAQWLSDVLDVPQPRLAALLAISPRQLSRWLSEADGAAPAGEEARRVRTVAQIVRQLRHALSGPGVMAWFEQPRAELDGTTPAILLGEPGSTPRLVALAERARSHAAT